LIGFLLWSVRYRVILVAQSAGRNWPNMEVTPRLATGLDGCRGWSSYPGPATGEVVTGRRLSVVPAAEAGRGRRATTG